MLGAEDAAGQQDQQQQKSGSGNSSRGISFRDKLKDRASKLTKSKPHAALEQQNVADFLRPSSSASSEHPKPSPVPPRIDTATQWSSSVAPEDRLEPLAFPVPKPVRKKRPKPPGIHVSFTEQEPKVIGEGGDECELPANQVIGSWTPSAPDHLSRPPDAIPRKPLEPPELLKIGNDEASSQSALRRAPTRAARASDGWQQKRLSMSMEEGLVQAKKEELPDPTAPQLPEPTISNLSLSFESSLKPFEDKPYITTQIDPAAPQTTSPTRGLGDSKSSFLAYNPSLRAKAGEEKPVVARPGILTDTSVAAVSDEDDLPDFGASPSSIYSPDEAELHTMLDDSDHEARLAAFDVSQISPPIQSQANGRQLSNRAGSGPDFEAAEEFFTRMQHMRGTFKLTAARPHGAPASELGRSLRASIWWFLKGKSELEDALRGVAQGSGRPSSRGGDGLPQNKQCYIDLTKSWWIVRDVLPDIMQDEASAHTDPADGLDAQEITDVYERTRQEISRFLFSLQSKNLLPPPALLVQGADPEIWIPYPPLPRGLYALAATLNPRTLERYTPSPPHLAFSMPLGDSDKAFSYGRFFGIAQVLGDASFAQQGGFHCVVSVIRDRSATLAEFLVASQDGQLSFHIQSDTRQGPTYSDVRWAVQPNTLVVRLAPEISMGIQLHEADFRFLQSVNDYNARLEVERFAKADEELLYGDVVRAFHYMGPNDVKSGFPSVPVPNCKVRLFQKSMQAGEGANSRKSFAGYRLTVLSPTDGKTLSSLTRHLTCQKPILYNNLKGQGGAPALALVLPEAGGKLASLIFTFETQAKRAAFHTIVAGTATSPDECFSEDIPVASVLIADREGRPLPLPHGIQWQRLRVINVGRNLDEASCLLSDRLRACISCNYGSLTDRINLGAGELRIALDPVDTTSLKLFRPAQNNLTLAFTEGAVRGSERQLLSDALAAANAAPSYRIYKFASLPVLHDFQSLVTGRTVLYDGVATAFSITRRRMVVPIHKYLDTDHARLQVLRDRGGNGAVHLVAFFKEFVAGKCMGVPLKGTDVYESSARSGKFFVRFVEAKFAMPEEAGDGSLCLDDPPFPSEHDDLVFGFDGEDERDLFAKALPASISKASRMASFRR